MLLIPEEPLGIFLYVHLRFGANCLYEPNQSWFSKLLVLGCTPFSASLRAAAKTYASRGEILQWERRLIDEILSADINPSKF